MRWTRGEETAARAASELKVGSYVNLGIGVPTLVTNYVDPDVISAGLSSRTKVRDKTQPERVTI